MKNQRVIELVIFLAILIQQIRPDDLEYNFEIKNGKNTLVVSKGKNKKNNIDPIKKTLKRSKRKSKSKKNKDDLSKMVKLGVLIDRITDKLEKDSNKKSLKVKDKKGSNKQRKAFEMPGMGTMAAVGGVAAVGVGAGLMAGAADNADLQVQIDKLKREQIGLYIKDKISEESNDLLNKSNRGFAVLKVKANTLITNFEQKFGIAYDHINTIIEDMENDYENVGAHQFK
jgi:hypothetical protein